MVDSTKTLGTILLNIKKDSVNSLKVDDKIALKATLKQLIPPLNPHQFNYKSYLAKQGILHQLFVEENHISNLGFMPKQSKTDLSLFTRIDRFTAAHYYWLTNIHCKVVIT